MTILPVFYGIAAGICLYATVYHLLVGFRQRPFDTTHLAFSFMAFLVAGMIVSDAAYRLATTTEGVVLTLHIGITLTAFALIAFLWFVAGYTDVQPRSFLWAMSLLFFIAGILNLLLPGGILYKEITGFRLETMPWGESFALIEGSPSQLQPLNILLFLLAYGYCFVAVTRQYRRGEKRRALFLLLGISPIIAATIFDFLLDFSVITNFIGLYTLSYLGLVFIMSLGLSDEVVQSSVLQREVAENERRMRSLLENVELVVIGLDAHGRVNYTNPFYTKITGFTPEEALGKDFVRELIPAPDQTEMHTVFSDFMTGDRRHYYQNPILKKDGSERIISWSNVRLRDSDDGVVGILSIGTDISDQLKAETELAQYREQLEELVDARTAELSSVVIELNTLNQIAKFVTTFLDLESTLQQVCQTVAPLFNAALVVVNVVDLERDAITVLAGFDRDAADERAPGIGQTLPVETVHLMQRVHQTKQPLAVTGLQAQPEALSPLLRERRIDALLLVPLPSRGEIMGVLGILQDELHTEFDAADVILAETIAGYVAGAIENTRLTQQLADTAVAEERSRIARELHDSVTQNLYTVATISDAIPDLWDTHPEETRQALENLRRLSRGALAEMRILLLELRPSSLLEKPLGQLLQQLGEGVEGRSRIQVTTTMVGDQPFSDGVQVALYRITQEALNNVIKHSEATQVTIGLYNVNDEVTLRVQDNGIGFDPTTAVNSGFGLGNMQERARQIHAKLEIESGPDEGTEVTVIWQNKQEAENE